ncbi:TadE/TadG family type IV pilus assembly protein [Streptomyces flavofungini]|uniref:TadE/TadG family type IV pilus assembly protein n=1 Tax=Streptomyces flavofungini TaxID=68200 RepID=UPI0034DEA807
MRGFFVRCRGRGRRLTGDDRGVSMLEFAGFLPVLLLVGLAAIQLGLVGYAAGQAGSGARAAARAASQGDSGEAAGAAAMDGGLDSSVGVSRGGGTTTATVEVRVPKLLPFIDAGWSVTKKATMPNDDAADADAGY